MEKPSDLLADELARHHVAVVPPADAPLPAPEEKYERLPTTSDLAYGSASDALEALGAKVAIEEAPVLHVSIRGWKDHDGGYWFPFQDAIGIALRYGMRLVLDPALDDMDEWFIEYRGRRVGSPGC